VKIGRRILQSANALLGLAGYQIAHRLPDMYLHEYDSYEQYREVQIFHNRRKIDVVWADEATLTTVGERVRSAVGDGQQVVGLCHGARNGWEQNFLADTFGFDVTGTDISETAADYARSVAWDFHDINPAWVGQCDFVYSNSLDQSWKPNLAVATWLDQLRTNGMLIVELNRWHEAGYAGEMDPFGVKVEYFPYLLAQWFGHRISVEIITGRKSTNDAETWLFVVKKLTEAPFRQ
jgi:hypothetical protein